TPLGRAGQPGECAGAYVFLASPCAASYVSGTVVGDTGGKPVFCRRGIGPRGHGRPPVNDERPPLVAGAVCAASCQGPEQQGANGAGTQASEEPTASRKAPKTLLKAPTICPRKSVPASTAAEPVVKVE